MISDDKDTTRERISIFDEEETAIEIPPRRRAGAISISERDEQPTPRDKNLRIQDLQKIGAASGFQSRDPSVKPIDGRSLRATNRTKQMNMKVTPEVNRLLLEQTHAQGFPSVGAYVEHLLYKNIKEK